MSRGLDEAVLEQAAMEWLAGLGYQTAYGPDISAEEPGPGQRSYRDVILEDRLRRAVERLNPSIPREAREEAISRVLYPASPSLVRGNSNFHRMLTEGVEVEYLSQGRAVGDRVRLADLGNPAANDWLAVNQFSVASGQPGRPARRPDVVIFLNGLPVAVVELKNPGAQSATTDDAFRQLQTYKEEIPSLFVYNEILVITDGLQAWLGSLTADRDRFMPWRTIEGEDEAPGRIPELQVLLQGVFERGRFLEYLGGYIVFEDEPGGLSKKIAGYHQFHAVKVAVESTVRAAGPLGDRKIGVVWHTQGSGKSLTMAFYAGRIIQEAALKNPTVVVITDRNDLDGQLFGTFARCQALFRQEPVQAESREHLRELLNVAAGGVVFTTIQKFAPAEDEERHPLLTNRHNVIVIADEAHRTQYGFGAKYIVSGREKLGTGGISERPSAKGDGERRAAEAGRLKSGYAAYLRQALPNAAFIAFTGTPIEFEDRSTSRVFGDYISIYDLFDARRDKATVPIYYESRLAKLDLNEAEKPRLDEDFEEIAEGEEDTAKEQAKRKWAAVEALVGADKRLNLVADDMLAHFDSRLRAMDGKAMIVTMSRRIAVKLYDTIVARRPQWHSDGDQEGAIKVVMTGSAADGPDWQRHIRSKTRRQEIEKRFKDPQDSLKVVIVRDMWLTGFDVPCLHTMYLDKPMKGHNLMQAITRVNRVFKDKPGGLIVDYLGLAAQLKQAMAAYAQGGGRGELKVELDQAVAFLQEKLEICRGLFHGFDYQPFFSGTATQRIGILPAAQEHIEAQQATARFLAAANGLAKAFALTSSRDEATAAVEEVAFFQAVRVALAKTTGRRGGRAGGLLDAAMEQLVSAAISAQGMEDIFALAGVKKPDVSILSEEFLAEIKGMPQRNLAAQLLQKLLRDEIRVVFSRNVVQGRSFTEMLEKAVKAYHNRAITAAKLIEELIAIARSMQEAKERGEELGLAEDELAFYDALMANESAVKALGDEVLRAIAGELLETVRRNTSIDWAAKESARARLRVLVKRVLRRHGYPPDRREAATDLVVKQAEALTEEGFESS